MGVDSRDMNADGGENGGENGYGTYVDDRGGKEEVLANPSDHVNHPANNWYRMFMTSSSSFVLLACVAAVSIGCVAINHLQLLSSSSSMVEGGAALSGSSNIDILSITGSRMIFRSFRACPKSRWSFSVFEPNPVTSCIELYFKDEYQMEEELSFIQEQDPDNKKGYLPMKASCKDREYPIFIKGHVSIGGPTNACYLKTYQSK